VGVCQLWRADLKAVLWCVMISYCYLAFVLRIRYVYVCTLVRCYTPLIRMLYL
jgi:hypothetical protein